MIERQKGDIDGFIRESEQANDQITYDRERRIVTILGAERSDCGCPSMENEHTPAIACDCALGWNRYVYETLLGRKFRVALKETVLRRRQPVRCRNSCAAGVRETDEDKVIPAENGSHESVLRRASTAHGRCTEWRSCRRGPAHAQPKCSAPLCTLP
ncbi:hypothetical protein Oter_1850 [Opitutus terrae PB90-1]|uniref:Uncharacterized protein n=2 Tax=Opitutus terrae TaxID=107709 RepID=B1ZX22_OPITP|nr:hypothetical protein Oter_1850 [Opitutus terrae PB90-1]